MTILHCTAETNDVFMFKNNSNARPVTPDGTALDYLSTSVTITVIQGWRQLFMSMVKARATDVVVAIVTMICIFV